LRQKESVLNELKSASGFIRFGLVNVEMLMGAWDTLHLFVAARDAVEEKKAKVICLRLGYMHHSGRAFPAIFLTTESCPCPFNF
jgi:hypothetical protein